MAHILVAEDDGSVRTFISHALQQRGHQVSTVEDGYEALEALSKDSFDLLITDIVMPGLDGIELALKASSELPDMPILLITGYSAERQRAHNLEELIFEVVTKPFTLSHICEVAERALKGLEKG